MIKNKTIYKNATTGNESRRCRKMGFV